LDDKGRQIERREDNKIPKWLEKGISGSRNTCAVRVSERILRFYRFPIVTYRPAEKRAGEMMRHVTCMIKYRFKVTSYADPTQPIYPIVSPTPPSMNRVEKSQVRYFIPKTPCASVKRLYVRKRWSG
jgi:hypothetical protein